MDSSKIQKFGINWWKGEGCRDDKLDHVTIYKQIRLLCPQKNYQLLSRKCHDEMKGKDLIRVLLRL